MSSINHSHVERVPAAPLLAKAALEAIAPIVPLADPVRAWLTTPATVVEHNFWVGEHSVSAILASFGPRPSRGAIVWGGHELTRDEIVALARARMIKNAMYRPPVGPLHGGSTLAVKLGFVPTVPERRTILDEITRLFPEIGDGLMVAPDSGNDADVATFYVPRDPWGDGVRAGTPSRGRLAAIEHSLGVLASGVGAAIAADEAVRELGEQVRGLTFAVTGWGRAARAMADHLGRCGAMLVGVSDGRSGTANPDGLSPRDLDEHLERGEPLSTFPGGGAASRHDVITSDADILALCDPEGTIAARGETVAIRSNAQGSRPICAKDADDVVVAEDMPPRLVVVDVTGASVYPAGLDVLEHNCTRLIGSLVGGGLGAYASELELMHLKLDDIMIRFSRQSLVYQQVGARASDWNVPLWVAEWGLGVEALLGGS